MSYNSWGVPWKGRKSRLAEKIINTIPRANNFFDLFAGGCAISHCAFVSKKYNKIICNDISGSSEFMNTETNPVVTGEWRRFVDRKEFFESDKIWIKNIYSFGNNLKSYIYGSNFENAKRDWHEFIVANKAITTPTQGVNLFLQMRGKWPRSGEPSAKDKYEFTQRTKQYNLQHIAFLEHLQRLQSFEHLPKNANITILKTDYKNAANAAKAGDVIYCDPPYLKTSGYLHEFNFDEFKEQLKIWSKKEIAVFVSEYTNYFGLHEIFNIKKAAMKGRATNSTNWRNEKLFCNDIAREMISKQNFLFADW